MTKDNKINNELASEMKAAFRNVEDPGDGDSKVAADCIWEGCEVPCKTGCTTSSCVNTEKTK